MPKQIIYQGAHADGVELNGALVLPGKPVEVSDDLAAELTARADWRVADTQPAPRKGKE